MTPASRAPVLKSSPPKKSGIKIKPFLIHCFGRMRRIRADNPLLSFSILSISFINSYFYLNSFPFLSFLICNFLEIQPTIFANIQEAGSVMAMQVKKVGQ